MAAATMRRSVFGGKRIGQRATADDRAMAIVRTVCPDEWRVIRYAMPVECLEIARTAAWMTSIVRGKVRPPSGNAAYVPKTTSDIVPTGTTTPTATTGNNIQIPTGYNALCVYVGAMPVLRETLKLYVNDGSTTKAIEVYQYSHIIIRAAAGTTLSFGSQGIDRNGSSYANVSDQTLTVVPFCASPSLAVTATKQVTITPDQFLPEDYSPTHAHLTFAAEYARITVEPSSRARDFFMLEADSLDWPTSLTPLRHIHIPANEKIAIQCRFRHAAFVSLDGKSITLNVPSSTEVDTTHTEWRSSFTAASTVNVSTVAAFKTAISTASDNIDIVLAPGVYDLQSASQYNMKPSNYSTALSYSRRIRSSTGKASDVVFRPSRAGVSGGQFWATFQTGVKWVFEDITFDMTGVIKNTDVGSPTGAINFTMPDGGSVEMSRVTVYGGYDGTNLDGAIKWIASAGSTATGKAFKCSFIGATHDSISCNVEAGVACTLKLAGCILDGNGPVNNDQVVTNHGGGSVEVWQCDFRNKSTGNLLQVASDAETSKTWLFYCTAFPENFVTTNNKNGLNIPGNALRNPTFVHFCTFDVISCDGLKSCIGSFMRCVGTGRAMMFGGNDAFVCRIVGCDLYGYRGSNASINERIIDLASNVAASSISITGSRLTVYSGAANQGVIRMIYVAGQSTSQTATFTNCLIRVNSGSVQANGFEVGSASTQAQILILKNCCFVSGYTDAIESISSTASTSCAATSCYFVQNASPSNWSKFTASAVTFSRTAAALTAWDAATAGGNIASGATGTIGGSDCAGRPWLGGEWGMTAAERQEVRASATLYPAVWPIAA